MATAQENRWDTGGELYDAFVEKLSEAFDLPYKVSTPRTSRLEIFALLANRPNLLHAEMMREYLSNVTDYQLVVEKGRLYQRVEGYERF